jgi:hypothetical protein
MKPILRHGLVAPDPQACAQFGLDLAQDRGQPIVNLVRQPEFRRYLEAKRCRMSRSTIGSAHGSCN